MKKSASDDGMRYETRKKMDGGVMKIKISNQTIKKMLMLSLECVHPCVSTIWSKEKKRKKGGRKSFTRSQS